MQPQVDSSRLIQAIEKYCRLQPKTLDNLGLTSVQEIANQSESKFVRENAKTLNSRRAARQVYRCALTAKNTLLKLSRRAEVLSGEIPSSELATTTFTNGNLSWTAQFPTESTQVALVGSINDEASPAAYAVALYHIALALEKEGDSSGEVTLDARRPDIANLSIDQTSVYQPLSRLTLANQLLENLLAEQMVRRLNIEVGTDASAQLAYARFPGPALPFHEPYDQVSHSLAYHQTTLPELFAVGDRTLPPFIQKPLAATDSNLAEVVFGAQLSPTQMQIVTETVDLSTNNIGNYYKFNYGWGAPSDAGVSTPTSSSTSSLSNISVFCQQTGLTPAQVRGLLGVAGTGIGNYGVTLSENAGSGGVGGNLASPAVYGSVYINGDSSKKPIVLVQGPETDADASKQIRLATAGNDEAGTDGTGTSFLTTGPSNDQFARINQMLRLQGWTGLPFDQLDGLLYASTWHPSQDKIPTTDTNTLRTIGLYAEWANAYGATAEDFAAFLCSITPYATGAARSQFDRIYNPDNRRPALRIDPPGSTTFDYTASEHQPWVNGVCLALKINQEIFLKIAPLVSNKQFAGQGTLLSKDIYVYTALYRFTQISHYLGINPTDLILLLQRLPEGSDLLANLAGTKISLSKLNTDKKPASRDFIDQMRSLAGLIAYIRAQRLTISAFTFLVPALAPDGSQQGFNVPIAGAATTSLLNSVAQAIPAALFDAGILDSLGLPAQVNWSAVLDFSEILDNGLVAIESPDARENALTTALQDLEDNAAVTTPIITGKQYQPLLDAITAAQARQYATTDGNLSHALQLDNSVLHYMMLAFGENASYSFLSACLTWSQRAAHVDASIAAQLLMPQLTALAHQTAVVKTYGLSAACLQCLMSYPKAFVMPLSPDDPWWMCSLLAQFSFGCYAACRKQAGNEDAVLQYLNDVSATPPSISVQDATIRLAQLLGQSYRLTQQAVNWAKGPTDPTDPTDGIACTTIEIGKIMALLAMCKRSGLSIKQILDVNSLSWQAAPPDSCTDDFTAWLNGASSAMATLSYDAAAVPVPHTPVLPALILTDTSMEGQEGSDVVLPIIHGALAKTYLPDALALDDSVNVIYLDFSVDLPAFIPEPGVLRATFNVPEYYSGSFEINTEIQGDITRPAGTFEVTLDVANKKYTLADYRGLFQIVISDGVNNSAIYVCSKGAWDFSKTSFTADLYLNSTSGEPKGSQVDYVAFSLPISPVTPPVPSDPNSKYTLCAGTSKFTTSTETKSTWTSMNNPVGATIINEDGTTSLNSVNSPAPTKYKLIIGCRDDDGVIKPDSQVVSADFLQPGTRAGLQMEYPLRGSLSTTELNFVFGVQRFDDSESLLATWRRAYCVVTPAQGL